MKILFIGSQKSNHSKKWVNNLVAKGHEVLLVYQHEASDTSVEFDPRVKTHMLKHGGYKSYILNVPELRKIYKEYRPDVVNVHYMSGYGLMATLAGARPLVLNCYGSDIFVAPKKSKVVKWIVKKLLNSADAVAATSKAMAAEAMRIMGSKHKEVTVTPFGVDVNLFKKDDNRKYSERPIIGIIKYLKPEYNIPLLIKAFAITKEKASVKPLLHIYGSGPLKGEFIALCKNLGIYEDVTFFETIPNQEVPKALNTMDIFVNSSNVESFGVNIVEAMACELPVVATPCPGPKEVIDNGVTGVVLKDWNHEELAEELIKLVENPALREKYGKAGREKVLREYDWSKNVETLINVYHQVAPNKV